MGEAKRRKLAETKKTIHRLDRVLADGSGSAACFATPHAIDPKRASWTTRLDPFSVTCPRCRKIDADKGCLTKYFGGPWRREPKVRPQADG